MNEKISTEDALRLRLADAELRAAKYQSMLAGNAFGRAQEAHLALLAEVARSYALHPGDEIDPSTGAIVRKVNGHGQYPKDANDDPGSGLSGATGQ